MDLLDRKLAQADYRVQSKYKVEEIPRKRATKITVL